jgi:hypothetical protein
MLSQSNMMDVGNLKCTQTWLKNSSTASHPKIVFLQGMSTHFVEAVYYKKQAMMMGEPHGDVLGLMTPCSNNCYCCFFNSYSSMTDF